MTSRKLMLWMGMSILLLTLPAWASPELMELYRRRQYQGVISVAAKSDTVALDEETQYLVALSHVQLGQIEKARQVMDGLLALDPTFYAYKLRFDPEIYPVLSSTDLKDKISSYESGRLAQSPLRRHQLVTTSAGLFLYANGIKVNLGDGKNTVSGGFSGDQSLYFIENVSPVRKKDAAKSRIHFYNVGLKAPGGSYEIPGQFSQARIADGRLVIQTSTSYQFFDVKNLSAVSPVQTGVYQDPVN